MSEPVKHAAALVESMGMVPNLALVSTVLSQCLEVLRAQALNEALGRTVDLACVRRAAALDERCREWLRVYIARADAKAQVPAMPATELPDTVRRGGVWPALRK